MNTLQQKAGDFLHAYEMDHTDIDFEANLTTFSEQMVNGLVGKESCLEMIPTYLETVNDRPVNQPVIVADAGGTNFRVAVIHFDEQKQPVIEKLQKFPMPAVERELNQDDFFKAMAGYFREVIGAAENVGFCFSYPVEVLPNKDGRLIRFSKEIKAPEVIHKRIGHNLNLAIGNLGMGSHKHIVLLNDTVATLLAGVGFQGRDFSSYIGFILGTGTNCCYVEGNGNITKQPDLDPEKSQIINTESGGMDRIHCGQLDKVYDQTTTNPDVHIFEKMISGAYLGPLFGVTVKQAAKDGVLSAPVAQALDAVQEIDTIQMNDFLFYPRGTNPLAAIAQKGTPEDTQLLYAIADRLVERAAKLTAINLSAMAIKSGQGLDPSRPICIVAEGTTFYHMKTLKSRIEFYLKENLEDKRGVYTDIIAVENATLIGAAIAGLTN